MSNLGFGEHIGQFMKVLLPFFGGFAAGFGRGLALLRFEANFLLALVGSELQEVVQGAWKARSWVVW